MNQRVNQLIKNRKNSAIKKNILKNMELLSIKFDLNKELYF